MKRLLSIAVLILAVVAIAQADWVSVYGPKPLGYQLSATQRIKGTQACTLSIPISVVANAKWLVFRVRADSVTDSVPSLQASFGYKSLLTGSAWVNTSFATADAGDTILPLDGDIYDTLLTQTVLLPHYSTLWSITGATCRIIFTGKRAFQSAKACSAAVYVKK
jgi:hypothetical protein